MPKEIKSGEHEFVGAVMDVTAAKEAEERIRQDERELRITLETIPASVSSTLPDGSVDFVNQRWLDYVGCSREQLLGSGWKQTIHPEDLDRVLNNWQAALAAGEPLEIELRHRGADSKYRWFLSRAVPLRDEKGNILKWYATTFDIEDRKRAEEKLRRSEAYLAEAQRLTHTGSSAFDIATRTHPYSSAETLPLVWLRSGSGYAVVRSSFSRGFIRRIETGSSKRSTEQSMNGRTSRWITESFFRTARSSTFT